jgi:hypothetical protein
MIYLENDSLEIRFPDLHENAGVKIDFQRTLRLPDNGETHHLPPGLGSFPLRHIEDFDLGYNNHLKKRGGVIMPMFQADAVWINFDSINITGEEDYPIAVKIGTGKVCAVSGDDWISSLNRNPQDYIVVPDQPWIDGYNVGKDVVKQFIAAPLGQGYTVEEQLKSGTTTGGIQIQVFPMKREFYDLLNTPVSFNVEEKLMAPMMSCAEPIQEMGLAAGGSMHQEIYEDPHEFDAWDLRQTERCFVTLANAEQWIEITDEEPPINPFTAQEYNHAGLPWFDYYGGDKVAIEGAKKLGKIKSIKNVKPKSETNFWTDGAAITNPQVVQLERRGVKIGDW